MGFKNNREWEILNFFSYSMILQMSVINIKIVSPFSIFLKKIPTYQKR